MADDPVGTEKTISIDLGDDGVAATHPLEVDFIRRVAPSLPGDGTRNTIRPFLTVVGCCTLPAAHFDFDSSFLLPDAKAAMLRLAKLRDDLAEPFVPTVTVPDPPKPGILPPLSIFGHTDPVGAPDFNSRLSQRRANVVFSALIRDVKTWLAFFSGAGEEHWGQQQRSQMEGLVGKRATLAALIEAYMDAICVRADAAGVETSFRLDPVADFLGGDPKGAAGVQGCGEFNPTFILSKDHERELDEKDPSHKERNAANRINRRVIAFLFKPGSRVDPARWPCPSVHNPRPQVVCADRLWLDHDRRMAPDQSEDREFKKTEDTFGCRFYHGIAGRSPCEGIHKQWVIRVLLDPPAFDETPRVLANRRFVVTVGDAPGSPRIRGKTDSEGVLRLPVFDPHTKMKLRLEVAKPAQQPGGGGGQGPNRKTERELEEEEKGFLEFLLDAGALRRLSDGSLPDDPTSGSPDLEKLAVRQRLHNLGYGPEVPEKWTDDQAKAALTAFQKREKLDKQDGTLDDPTKQRIGDEHEPEVLRPGDGGEEDPQKGKAKAGAADGK